MGLLFALGVLHVREQLLADKVQADDGAGGQDGGPGGEILDVPEVVFPRVPAQVNDRLVGQRDPLFKALGALVHVFVQVGRNVLRRLSDRGHGQADAVQGQGQLPHEAVLPGQVQ